MLTDPQSLTYNGTATSLPLVSSGTMSRDYVSADGSLRLSISHVQTKAGRWRRVIRVRHTKIAADPFTSGKNLSYDCSFSVIADMPSVGYTAAELDLVADSLLKWCTGSGSTAVFDRVVAGES